MKWDDNASIIINFSNMEDKKHNNWHEAIGPVVKEVKFFDKTNTAGAKLSFSVETRLPWTSLDGEEKESRQTHLVNCWDDLAVEYQDKIKEGIQVRIGGPHVTWSSGKGNDKRFFHGIKAKMIEILEEEILE